VPNSDGDGEGQTLGRIDPDLGPVYRPQGDPCRDYCICVHERKHVEDVASADVANMFLDHVPQQQIINWLECRAYKAGTDCLESFIGGGEK
jgi:hypothetical protein